MEDKARVYLSAAKADIEHLLRVAEDMDPDVRVNSIESAIQSLQGAREEFEDDVSVKIDSLSESGAPDPYEFSKPPDER